MAETRTILKKIRKDIAGGENTLCINIPETKTRCILELFGAHMDAQGKIHTFLFVEGVKGDEDEDTKSEIAEVVRTHLEEQYPGVEKVLGPVTISAETDDEDEEEDDKLPLIMEVIRIFKRRGLTKIDATMHPQGLAITWKNDIVQRTRKTTSDEDEDEEMYVPGKSTPTYIG